MKKASTKRRAVKRLSDKEKLIADLKKKKIPFVIERDSAFSPESVKWTDTNRRAYQFREFLHNGKMNCGGFGSDNPHYTGPKPNVIRRYDPNALIPDIGEGVTIEEYIAQINESQRLLYEAAENFFVGKMVRVISSYNGQPYGRSKKPLTGKEFKIIGVNLFPELSFLMDGQRLYILSTYVQFIE